MDKLYSTPEAAAILGKAPSTIRQNARRHGIGTVVGRSRVFNEADLERLRAVPGPGQPRKHPKPPPA